MRPLYGDGGARANAENEARILGSQMTEEEPTVLAIKGAITELPPAEREQCEAMIEHLRRMIADAGIVVGGLAVALIGAEMQMGTWRHEKVKP